MMRGMVGCAAVLTLAAVLVVGGCSKEEDRPRRRGRSVAVGAAGQPEEGAQEAQRAEGGREEGELRTRVPNNVVQAPAGRRIVGAPVHYLHTAIRTRSYASDRLRIIAAEKAVRDYTAIEGRKPASIKELNNWLVEGGNTALAQPDRGGEYRYDPESGKVVIVDPTE